MKALPLVLLLLPACASTTFYRDGLPIARFQGDMTGVEYSDGKVRWKAASVDHSTPTRARGEAAVTALQSAAAPSLFLLK